MPVIESVAVVGLGPAGLAAIKELRASGLKATGFDSREEIGGMWALQKNGQQLKPTRVYKELTLNSTRSTSEFSDFPWKAEDYNMQELDEGGFFPSQAETGAYLQAYAKQFNLQPHFRLGTTITSIVRNKDDAKFLVKTVNKGKKEEELAFDAVIMCNGRFGTPKNFNALCEGVLKNFSGEIIHSQQVESIKDYPNKRVLIIGGAVSGTDLSYHMSMKGGCQTVVNSVRRPHYYLYKFTKTEGKALELAFFKRIGVWLMPYLPESVAIAGFQSELLKNFPDQLTPDLVDKNVDLIPPKNMKDGTAGYGSEYVSAVKEGKLKVKPAIASAQGHKITFKDGTSQEFDVIICATGYQGADLSMFPKPLADQIGFMGLTGMQDVFAYKRTLIPDIPNLAFTKCDSFGANFPTMEMQARYVAAIWSGKLKRPNESKIRQGALVIKNFRLSGKQNTYDLTHQITEELGDELGVTPTLAQAMCNPSELLLGPLYPCYYRTNPAIDGEKVAAQAKERLEWCKANPAILPDK